MDPTYGYDLQTLLRVGSPEPPDDFADFWKAMYARAREVAVAPAITSGPRWLGDLEVYDISYTSTDGVRLGGWLTVPGNGPVRRGIVAGHGYGGRDAPDPVALLPDAATIFPCARGLGARGLVPELPDTAALHVLHGISNRDRYIHGGCAADLWCAATALAELVPEAAARLDYVGGSFGGGIGALALGWDDRFTAGCLHVPSFGNHPLRLTLRCTGSGEAVRHYARTHPEIVDVLRYFDAATAARFLSKPMLVAAALADPAVPPPGQFAVHNALPGPKQLVVSSAGHMEYAEEEAETRQRIEAERSFLLAPTSDPADPSSARR